MTTIVGIFDDAWNVEKAIEQLAAAGFEDTVYDEAILQSSLAALALSHSVHLDPLRRRSWARTRRI
jgi:hypothetical protein